MMTESKLDKVISDIGVWAYSGGETDDPDENFKGRIKDVLLEVVGEFEEKMWGDTYDELRARIESL